MLEAKGQELLPSLPTKDIINEFKVETMLGDGGFAHVVQARDRQGHVWALKLMPVPKDVLCTMIDSVEAVAPMLLREAREHMWLSNEPSVLPCVEAFKTVYTDCASAAQTFLVVLKMPVAPYNAMEWLLGSCGNVPPCVQQYAPADASSPTSALMAWAQMVNAVWRLHCRGVVHKDIKLENFMMDVHGRVQLIDFGLVQVQSEGYSHIGGTPWTMSPAGFNHQDDREAGDWWSLGIILYQLLQQGAWPFKRLWWPWEKDSGERMEAAIKKAVLRGRVKFSRVASQQAGAAGQEVLPAARMLILGLLEQDASRRWQLPQVLSSPLMAPELLQELACRFPDLAQDMHDLLVVQHQALASGMGASAGSKSRDRSSGGGGSSSRSASTKSPSSKEKQKRLTAMAAQLLSMEAQAGQAAAHSVQPTPLTAAERRQVGSRGYGDLNAPAVQPADFDPMSMESPFTPSIALQGTLHAASAPRVPAQGPWPNSAPLPGAVAGSAQRCVITAAAAAAAALSDGNPFFCALGHHGSATSLHELFGEAPASHRHRLPNRASSILDVQPCGGKAAALALARKHGRARARRASATPATGNFYAMPLPSGDVFGIALAYRSAPHHNAPVRRSTAPCSGTDVLVAVGAGRYPAGRLEEQDELDMRESGPTGQPEPEASAVPDCAPKVGAQSSMATDEEDGKAARVPGRASRGLFAGLCGCFGRPEGVVGQCS